MATAADKRSSADKEVREELMALLGTREKLTVDEVVEYARQNRRSAVRRAFDKKGLFNDKKAAAFARDQFAQQLIARVRVRIATPTHGTVPVRAFVNLTEERHTEEGGYRPRREVLSDAMRRAMFARDAVRDIEAVIRRYVDLLEDEQVAALRDVAYEISANVEEASIS